jgi:AraC-like DNA-binding protein
MTPAQLAKHFCISSRHLHKLFARSGDTAGRHILHKRLAWARSAF